MAEGGDTPPCQVQGMKPFLELVHPTSVGVSSEQSKHGNDEGPPGSKLSRCPIRTSRSRRLRERPWPTQAARS